jgi:2-methylcitrate dehydratase PrpD
VPAVLAVAEEMKEVNSENIVAAVAAATDVHARIAMMAPEAGYKVSKFSSTQLILVFGAAAAAAKMLGLGVEATQNAMGLAYAQAAGNYQGSVEGGAGLRLQAGFAVRNGIMAAELAKRGLAGVQEFLSGECGLYAAFYPGREVNWDLLGSGSRSSDAEQGAIDVGPLGEKYMGEELGFKAYPCCLAGHGVLDALRELGGAYDVEALTRVRVYGNSHLRIMMEPREFRYRPRSFTEAALSLPWVMACMIIDGNLKLEHFSEAALGDARYRRMASCVEVDFADDRKYAAVEIDLRDGKTLASSHVVIPHGHPSNPLSSAEIVNTFTDCISHGPNPDRLPRLAKLPELLLRDDGLPDMGSVFDCLRAS